MQVTVLPAETVLGLGLIVKLVAAAGLTVMLVWEPVIDDVTVSVAVIDWGLLFPK